MGRKSHMTWSHTQRRWLKNYRGKMYAISCRQLGTPENKEASQSAASRWWETKLLEIQGAKLDPLAGTDYGFAIDRLKQMGQFYAETEDEVGASHVRARIADMKESHRIGEKLPAFVRDPVRALSPQGQAVWSDRFKQMEQAKASVAADRTIKALIATILDRKAGQVAAGQRSAGRWDVLRVHLATLASFLGEDSPIEVLTADKLEAYHNWLLKNSGWSVAYKQNLFTAAKQFIKYAWGKGLVDLPRNIGSPDFDFKKAPKKIALLTVAEYQELLGAAPPRLKLFLLLMANCGMTQKDIAALKQSDVEWAAGRIIRKRSKTETVDAVPTVNYKLWPETFKLLKAHRSDDAEVVFTNANGSPLLTETIATGRLQRSDNIVSSYKRLQTKLGMPQGKRKPLKLIRKTAATMLEAHTDYGRYAQHFLGHSPQSVAERHYVVPDQKNFDAAVAWLGMQMLPKKCKKKAR